MNLHSISLLPGLASILFCFSGCEPDLETSLHTEVGMEVGLEVGLDQFSESRPTPQQEESALSIGSHDRLFMSVLSQLPESAWPSDQGWSIFQQQAAAEWMENNLRGKQVYLVISGKPTVTRNGSVYSISVPVPECEALPVEQIWPGFQEKQPGFEVRGMIPQSWFAYQSRNRDQAIRADQADSIRLGIVCRVEASADIKVPDDNRPTSFVLDLTLSSPNYVELLPDSDQGLPAGETTAANFRPSVMEQKDCSGEAIAVNPKNNHMYLGDSQGNIHVWDLKKKKRIKYVKGGLPTSKPGQQPKRGPHDYLGGPAPLSSISTMLVSADGKRLDAHTPGIVRSFRLPDFTMIDNHIKIPSNVINSLTADYPKDGTQRRGPTFSATSISADKRYYAINIQRYFHGHTESLVEIRNAKDGSSIYSHRSPMANDVRPGAPRHYAARFSADSKMAILRLADGRSKLISVSANADTSDVESRRNDFDWLSKDGSSGIVINNGVLQTWQPLNQKIKSQVPLRLGRNEKVLTVDPTGRLVCSDELNVWDGQTGQLLRSWSYLGTTLPNRIALSPDHRWVVATAIQSQSSNAYLGTGPKTVIYAWPIANSGFAASSRWVPANAR